MSIGHRLSRLASDLRAVHDRLLTRAAYADAAEVRRVATELEHCRIALEQVDSAADTGVLSLDDPAMKRGPTP